MRFLRNVQRGDARSAILTHNEVLKTSLAGQINLRRDWPGHQHMTHNSRNPVAWSDRGICLNVSWNFMKCFCSTWHLVFQLQISHCTFGSTQCQSSCVKSKSLRVWESTMSDIDNINVEPYREHPIELFTFSCLTGNEMILREFVFHGPDENRFWSSRLSKPNNFMGVSHMMHYSKRYHTAEYCLMSCSSLK